MTIDEQDISIEIPEDQAEKQVESEPKPAETKKTEPVDTPDELTDLKRQLEAAKQAQQDERKRAHTYEMQAREAAEARKNAESQYADSRIGTISSAIDAEEARSANAKRAYADAMAQGDFNAAADSQQQMAKAEARLFMLTQGKEELETPSRQQRTTEGAVRGEPQDPVDALARRLSIPSAQWVRNHPEVANDVEALGAAHSAAVHLDKVRVDTPEYFAAVEKHLGIRQVAAEVPQPSASEPSRRTPSAPVGASASAASRNSGGNIVTLTGAERDMARTLFDDKPPAEAERLYAINKAALIKEGKYDKTG